MAPDSLSWDLVAPGYAELGVEFFERFASDAVALCGVDEGDRVLDLAAGPGTVSLQVATVAERVEALDISSEMLAHLRRRADERGISNVRAHCGDGQNLPFGDHSFDVAFSMFGLMFFPDRSAGFRELYRVLKPGGRCVVASWHPIKKLPIFAALFEAIYAELPELPRQETPPPLGTREEIQQEMGDDAGFEVTVHSAVHDLRADSLKEFIADQRRIYRPLVLLENHFGTASFEPIVAGLLRRLEAEFGPGPVSVPMTAWLAEGRK